MFVTSFSSAWSVLFYVLVLYGLFCNCVNLTCLFITLCFSLSISLIYFVNTDVGWTLETEKFSFHRQSFDKLLHFSFLIDRPIISRHSTLAVISDKSLVFELDSRWKTYNQIFKIPLIARCLKCRRMPTRRTEVCTSSA